MRLFFGLSLCAALTLSISSAALAVTTSGPVRVAACIVYSRNTNAGRILTPNIDVTNGVQVTLVNDSTKTTSDITVTGSYHGRTVTDSVKANLKPGASMTIQRSYYPPSTYIDANAQCHVVKVDFTDGTTWSETSQ